MKNAIKYHSNSNCNSFDDDIFGSLLEFKWSKKKKNDFNEIQLDTSDKNILNRSIYC